MEKIPRALASTPAAFSLESRLPLERELGCKCVLLKARLRRQRLPFDTSSQFTPRRLGQRGPQTQARRSRSRLPRNSRKLVEAQLRRQRLPLDTSSQFTPRSPGQRGPPITGTALLLETFSRIAQVGFSPAGALARLTAMAAWCAYRVPNASPRSWYEKTPPKKGVGSLT